jgi:hypothetical protein
MTRPAGFENLIKTNALEAVAPTPGAVAGFLSNAEGYRASAKEVDPTRYLQIFTMAYEGYFQVVQAILEFYEVRTKDSGRNLAIQLVSSTLGASPVEQALIAKTHARRNGMSYGSPFPPVSSAEAQAMLDILEKYLPVARQLTGTPA